MRSLRVGGAGGGGKGGRGGGGISESPDTLSSVALARFIDLIGEGPIEGLVNNEYSIYLDGVPLRDLQGTPNYRPFRWDMRSGTQGQDPMPHFVITQQENTVGLKLLKTQGKLIRSVPDAGADAVRVTVSVNGLTETSSKGEINGTTVDYRIWVRLLGGTWVPAYDGGITGKTSGRYQRSHEVPLTNLGPGPYEVAVERVSDDSTSSLLVNGVWWDSYTIINYEKLTYPNSALVGVEIDARYFNQVPQRSYHLRGLIVKLPTNYDPIARTYATSGQGTTNGAWDGTFKTGWTDNPAWCFYDMLTNRRYGAGRRVPESTVDKWALYQIAQYCDGAVPTGNASNVYEIAVGGGYGTGGQSYAPVPIASGPSEPRFTLNGVINTRDDAYKVLNQLASVFRGMAYWASGAVLFSQDRPTDPSFIFTNANVAAGEFNYEGSSRSQRYTVVSVGWNDPTENFKQKFEYIEDRAGIARYGVRPTEIIAFGCTSRSQARRVGLWFLYTERMEKDVVTFRAGMEAATLAPGLVGQIMDVDRAGARWGGRVTSATTTTVTLDAAVSLTAGTYTLTLVQPDGTIVSRAVNIGADGNYSDLTVAVALVTVPQTMSVWTLASTTVTPMLVRVAGVKQEGATEFTVSCIENNPSKYAAIELGARVTPTNYSFLSLGAPAAVSNLTAVENTFKVVDGAVVINVEVGWDVVADPLVRAYRLRLISPNGTQDLGETIDSHSTLKNLTPGDYTISVRTVGQLGMVSAETLVSLTVTGNLPEIPASEGSDGTTSDTPDVKYDGTVTFNIHGQLVWTWQSNRDPQILGWEVREGSDWVTASKVAFDQVGVYTVSVVSAAGKTYLARAKLGVDEYALTEYRLSVGGGDSLSQITEISVRVVEPNIELTWPRVAGATGYSVFIEEGGVTRTNLVTGTTTLIAIPKYSNTQVMIRAVSDTTGAVAIGTPVVRTIDLSGRYTLNEVVNVPLPLNQGTYLNFAHTSASQVTKPNVLGATGWSVPIDDINDAALYTFARQHANTAADAIKDIPAKWFRTMFWLEREGTYESAVIDLGSVWEGRLKLTLTRTVTYLGPVTSAYQQTLAEHVASVPAQQMDEQRTFVGAVFRVSEDGTTWKNAQDGDYVKARYVSLAVSVLYASPLAEIKVTAGVITIDVVDITESGKTANVGTSVNVSLTKPFREVRSVLTIAAGNAKAWPSNVTATDFTINKDIATAMDVYWFAKGV